MRGKRGKTYLLTAEFRLSLLGGYVHAGRQLYYVTVCTYPEVLRSKKRFQSITSTVTNIL